MKLVILVCLAVVALAAPKPEDLPPIVQVLRDEREHGEGGNFRYLIETDNGIFMEAAGAPGVAGQSNIQGSYR
ncbi:Cuticle protein AMP1A [Portunus trituberculatus]|uniref:Cuticle protein AMP1A n=2 Tax=Portunus trituberculatus TaxID=210409 RepID=A0A5B7IJL1_PORTR|nr:Cuticle protein AMP1A [Portunus trituberculatus]